METNGWIEIGREVMLAEAEAVSIVANGLDHRFDEAVDLLLSCTGRIVVFGLGKSGQPSDADLAKALGDFQLPPDLAKMFDQPKNQGPR